MAIAIYLAVSDGHWMTGCTYPTRNIMEWRLFDYENNEMTIASDLLQQHIRTLVHAAREWENE
jgi:hypothetical protein